MIQIAQYRGVSPVSKLIEWHCRSPYSHTALLFTEDLVVSGPTVTTLRSGNVIEAWQTGGVVLSESLSSIHTDKTQVDLFSFKDPLSASEASTIAAFALAQLGKPYDFVDIERFITREAPPASSIGQKWFCSELTFSACKEAGRLLLEQTEAWEVPPDWVRRSPLLQYSSTVYTTTA